MKTETKISIIWRNENYGSVSRAVAFRAVVEPYPSDTAMTKLARIYKRCGFEMNQNRVAWIAEDCAADAPAKLIAELTAAGYVVEHRGCFRSLDEVSAFHKSDKPETKLPDFIDHLDDVELIPSLEKIAK